MWIFRSSPLSPKVLSIMRIVVAFSFFSVGTMKMFGYPSRDGGPANFDPSLRLAWPQSSKSLEERSSCWGCSRDPPHSSCPARWLWPISRFRQPADSRVQPLRADLFAGAHRQRGAVSRDWFRGAKSSTDYRARDVSEVGGLSLMMRPAQPSRERGARRTGRG